MHNTNATGWVFDTALLTLHTR